MSTSVGGRRVSRSPAAFWLLLAGTVLATVGFARLGVWQVHRRVWKLELIAEIDSRIHAAAVDAPGPADWPAVNAARDAYRRVRVRGIFLNDRETQVQAVTDLGAGYWVMTPLATDQGFTVLVNRGFVAQDQRDPATRPDGQIRTPTEVTGLLRITEPHGGFLRANDPADERWYSRDVAAITQARHLADAAPYFIDAAATLGPSKGPVGGLTVIDLPNSHLVYAVTWFIMAVLSLAASVFIVLDSRRGAPEHGRLEQHQPDWNQ